MSDGVAAGKLPGGGSIPVYKDLVGAKDAWTDGHFELNDITSGAGAGLAVLGAALNPVDTVLNGLVDWALNAIVNAIGPLKKAIDDLLGDPDAIGKAADGWSTAGQTLTSVGQRHASYARDTPSWTGTAADTYHQVLQGETGLYASAVDAAASGAAAIGAAGAIVGAIRGFLWGLLVQFVTQAIEAALAAAASSVITLGGSVGAFMGWMSFKIGSLCGKFTSTLAKLMRTLAKVARKLHLSGDKFTNAAHRLESASHNLGRNAGRNLGRSRIPNDPSKAFQTDWQKNFYHNHPNVKKGKDWYDDHKKYILPAAEAERQATKSHDAPPKHPAPGPANSTARGPV